MPIQSSAGELLWGKNQANITNRDLVPESTWRQQPREEMPGHCWLTAISLLTWIGKSVCSITRFTNGLKVEFPGFCPWVASHFTATAKPREGSAAPSLVRREELRGQPAAAPLGCTSHFPFRLLPRKRTSSRPSMSGCAFFFPKLCSTKTSHSSAEGSSPVMQSPAMQSPTMQSPPAAQGYSCLAAAILTGGAGHPGSGAKPNPLPREPGHRVPAAQLCLHAGGGGTAVAAGGQEGPFPGIAAPPLRAPHPHRGRTDAVGRGAWCRCHPGRVPSPPVNQAASRVEGDFGCKQSSRPCRRNVGSNKGAFVRHRAPSQCPRPGPPPPRHRTFPPAFS